MTRHYTMMRVTTFLVVTIAISDLSAQQGPATGYAPVNGLNMYYEVLLCTPFREAVWVSL